MTLIRTRDMENLSAYLDGVLSDRERSRLEARLSSDPSLQTALDDLRSVRSVLRQLPRRRVPRNFTLTMQQAGVRQPIPRAVPFLRLASALTGILLFLSLTTWVLPRLSFGAAATVAEQTAIEEMMVQSGPAEPMPAAGDTSLAPSPTATGPGMGGGIEEPPPPASDLPLLQSLPPGALTSISLVVVW